MDDKRCIVMKKVLFNLMEKLFGSFISKKIKEAIEKFKTENFDSVFEMVNQHEKLLTPDKVKKILDPSLHEFQAKRLKIRVNKGQYSDQMVFFLNKRCWTEGPAEIESIAPFGSISEYFNGLFDKSGKQHSSGWPRDYWVSNKNGQGISNFLDLFNELPVSKIRSLSCYQFEITKSGAVSWDEVLPLILEKLESSFPEIKESEEEHEQTSVSA